MTIRSATRVALLLSLGLGQSLPSPRTVPTRPRLTVLMVLDGLRGDLLDRYDSLFTGGFRRLRDGGFRFSRAMVDHGITVSHAGHVTIETGRYPAHHGIVDAGFYVPDGHGGRRLQDAIADSTTRTVGIADRSPSASPRLVLTSGLSDWVRTSDVRSRVVAIGTGRYSSLLHVYHPGIPVFWFDGRAGQYVTSSFYLDTLPRWVRSFNAAPLTALADGAEEWRPLVDLARFDLGRPDSNRYERYGRHSAFPHRLVDELAPGTTISPAARRRWLEVTPWLDLGTLQLADTAIAALSLGGRGVTDYLSLVLSETDNVGHDYGPDSHEMLDLLLRLDRWLGDFLQYLDRTVGAGRWTLALTADHGMGEIPEWVAEHEHPAWRITDSMIRPLMRDAARLAASGRDADLPALVRGRPWIAAFYSPVQLAGRARPDTFIALLRHSWRPDRVPRLPIFDTDSLTSTIAAAGWMVRLSPGSLIDLDPANHGSPYDYDRHVPLLFYGAGVGHGSSDTAARTIDVAPTLAELAGVPAPRDLDGRSLRRWMH